MNPIFSIDLGILSEMTTNEGTSLQQISNQQPVMLFFLRHFGCTFCREALDELAKKRKQVEANGTKIVLVHMADDKTAVNYFKKFRLPNVAHISDLKCCFYAHFGLTKGSFAQLFGLQSFVRGFESSMIKGYGLSGPIGDGFQMPGIFLIYKGEIKESFVHKMASDRPDYLQIANCCAL